MRGTAAADGRELGSAGPVREELTDLGLCHLAWHGFLPPPRMTMSCRPLLSATERSLIRLVVPCPALRARPYGRLSGVSAASWTRVRVVHGIRSHGYQDDAAACSRK